MPILKFARRFEPEPKTWSTDPAPEGGGPIELLLSENHWLVFDLDRHEGKPDGVKNWLTQSKEIGAKLPPTWMVKTRSNGRHIYFRIPPGVVITLNGTLPLGDEAMLASVEVKTQHIRSPYEPGYELNMNGLDEPALLPEAWVNFLVADEARREGLRLERKKKRESSKGKGKRLRELFQQYNEEHDSELPSARTRCPMGHGSDFCRLKDAIGRWGCWGSAHPTDWGRLNESGEGFIGDMVDLALHERNEPGTTRNRTKFIKEWAEENGIYIDEDETPVTAVQAAVEAQLPPDAPLPEVDPASAAWATNIVAGGGAWGQLTGVERYVATLLAEGPITYHLGGDFYFRGEYVSAADVVNKMHLINQDQHGKKDRIGTDDINRAFELWKRQQVKNELRLFQETIAYIAAIGTAPLENWVRATTGKCDPLDLIALKQWVWQVKRKLHGMSTENHLMLVLHGKTGCGKTQAIERMLKPLERVVATPHEMTILNDERQLYRLVDNYVVFFDEMGRAELTDLEALKRAITGKEVEYRILHTQTDGSGPNNATFIGASERRIDELVHDSQGARRFWQLHCLPKMDWEGVNAIDYLDFWRSVDHQAPSPAIPYVPELREIQDREFRANSSVEDWIEEEGFERTDPVTGESNSDNDLYTHYNTWMRNQGRNKKFNAGANFRDELVRIFGESILSPTRMRGGRYRVYLNQPDQLKIERGSLPQTK